MTLRDELIAMNDNNLIEAASYLAARLTRGDPDMFKVGYSQENAILAAVELFPEVTPFQIRFNNRWGSLMSFGAIEITLAERKS